MLQNFETLRIENVRENNFAENQFFNFNLNID